MAAINVRVLMAAAAACLLLKKRKEIQRRRNELLLAIRIESDLIIDENVGSGRVAYNGRRRAPAMLSRDAMKRKMAHQILKAPHKLQDAIGVTGKEFKYLAFYYEVVRRKSGGIHPGSRFRTTSWGDVWPELYMLLDFLHNGLTLKQMESSYQFSSSAVEYVICHAMEVYVALMTVMMGNLWPSVAEQDDMITQLPRPGSSALQSTSAGQNNLPEHGVAQAAQNRIVRQGVECVDRGLGQNQKKMRYPLGSPGSRRRCALFFKCATLHKHAVMKMRGQVCLSNPQILNTTGPRGRADPVEKIILQGTETLFTASDRSRRFFGPLRNGIGHVFPDVLPFPGFPVP